MSLNDLLPAIRPVLAELDRLGIAYYVGLATPEDVILHKLVWYRKGGETSERQWRDIAGVLKQQQGRLDTDYLADWADRLNVRDLWERFSW